MIKLPVFYIDIDLEDDITGMSCISFVRDPAVEVDFMCFEKEKQIFAKDEDQHIVFGPAIIADKPIYRNKDGYEFNVVFTKDVIKKIVEKYTAQNLWNTVSLQHDGNNITSALCVEHYQKDTARGISPKGFEEVTDGSLFCSFKILDDKLWDEIKNNDTINGYSIEIASDLIEKMSKEENVEDIIEEYIKGFKQDHFAAKIDKVDPLIPAINDIVAPPNIDLNTFNYESLKFAIENKLFVMLSYSGTSGTGSRQCAIMSWGDTIAGNECIRVSQDFGSSESGEMGCKLLLTSDITSFHVLTFMRPWTSGEIGYYGETSTGENGTMINVKMEATV